MFENNIISHHIERSILLKLATQEYARFRDLRPKRVETNLFSYHLKSLVTSGYVKKTDTGYTLSTKGLIYVDRVSIVDKMLPRTQPKIITMLLVQNSLGEVLLQKRGKQPYINTWTLPYGKLHIDDGSVIQAAIREFGEKLAYTPDVIRHVGDCYIVVEQQGYIISRTLAHITRCETDAITANNQLRWIDPLSLNSLQLAPAVEQIVARAFFGDNFFFEEFRVAT